ncbi:hypothetical protein, partial [Marinobacter sp.]|uniref:hypothetical protein n=1 Tax=Marinobacter sp. TaxID=50741 RepID=UPI002590E242
VAYSTSNRCLVNRFLKNFETRNLQSIQTIAFQFLARLSGVPLERDAYSTELTPTVNGSL